MASRQSTSLRRSQSARLSSAPQRQSMTSSRLSTSANLTSTMRASLSAPQQPPQPEKVQFSQLEQLKILSRLKAGEFSRRGGLKQFEIEKKETGGVRWASSKTIDEEDPEEEEEEEEEKVNGAAGEAPAQSVDENPNFIKLMGGLGDPAEYAKLPQHIKDFDKLIISLVVNFKTSQKLSNLLAKATVAKAFPNKAKLGSIFVKMKRMTRAMKNFNRLTLRQKYEIFTTPKEDTNPTEGFLNCSVEDQKKIVDAIMKANELMEKIQHLSPEKLIKLVPEKLKELEETINEMDAKLTKLEDMFNKYYDFGKKVKALEKERKELKVAAGTDSDSESSDEETITSSFLGGE